MTKLDELIKELCPDGVEYKTLGEVAKVIRGERITKNDLIENGEFPVMSGGTSFFGRYNKWNRKENTITVAQYGSAGYVDFIKERFWANDVCYSVLPDDFVDNKFLYYVLCNNQKLLYKLTTKAIPDCLPKERLESILIPVPPLAVQEEIVRILDKFTELEKELEKELENRRKQYEYYRDALLTPPFTYGYKGESGSHSELVSESVKYPLKHPRVAGVRSERSVQGDKGEVQIYKLKDLFDTRNGYTPSTSNPDFWENGTIPWFVMDDIRKNGRVLSNSIQHITKSAVKKSGLFPAGSIIVATSATIGEHALITTDFLCNQRFTCLSPKSEFKNQIDMKFMFYYAFKLDEFCKRNTTVSSFASVDMSKFYDFQIPIPPLPVQQRIVNVLDNFDAICADLKIGLPAEIEARKKQYEYYRDMLLTFTERGNTILTEQNRTEQNRTEQNRTEQNRTEQNRTEQMR